MLWTDALRCKLFSIFLYMLYITYMSCYALHLYILCCIGQQKVNVHCFTVLKYTSWSTLHFRARKSHDIAYYIFLAKYKYFGSKYEHLRTASWVGLKPSISSLIWGFSNVLFWLHCVVKQKHLRSLIRGITWGFEWVEILDFRAFSIPIHRDL